MKLTNPDLTSMQTNDLFQRIDQDGNHCISFIEFLAATLDPDDVDANELKQVRVHVGLFQCTCVPDLYCAFLPYLQAFRLIDHENKGYISRDDVYRILCTTNVEDLEYAHEHTRATTGTPTHLICLAAADRCDLDLARPLLHFRPRTSAA
jgi:hypothetical protein